MDASVGTKAATVIFASFSPPLFFNLISSIAMNPSPDSAGHGKKPMLHPFSSSSSQSSSSSSSSEGRRFPAIAGAGDEECCVCGRRFGNLKALSGHMRCHPEREWRGIRPLAVGEEGSRGRRRWRRRRPEESPAAATVAGEYACGECARVFRTRQALGGHRASHRGVKGCSAKAKETTTTATATATAVAEFAGGGDGRAFCCQVCERKFVTYHGMRVHQRVHRERQGGERGLMVDLNLPPPPEVAEEEDKAVAKEQEK